ncbi:MAG: hypothetical protein ACJAXI_003577, partial [Crocinitomicaceae bacterium]
NQWDLHGNKIGVWKSVTNKFTVYTKYIESSDLTTKQIWTVAYNFDNELKYFNVYTKNGQYQLDQKEQKLLDEKIESFRNSR